LQCLDQNVVIQIVVGALVDEDAYENVEGDLVVLTRAFHSESVVNGADFVLHILDFEVRGIVAECAKDVRHFVYRNRVGENASLLGFLAIHVFVLLGTIFVALPLGSVTELSVLEIVLHVLLEIDVTDHLNQFFFLREFHETVGQFELALDGVLIKLPDFN